MRIETTSDGLEIREAWRAVALVLLAAAAVALVRLATAPGGAGASPGSWITIAFLLGLAFWFHEQQVMRVERPARRIVWHRLRLGRARMVRELPFDAVQDVVVESHYGSDTIQTYRPVAVLKDGARVPLTRSCYADRETIAAVASQITDDLQSGMDITAEQ